MKHKPATGRHAVKIYARDALHAAAHQLAAPESGVHKVVHLSNHGQDKTRAVRESFPSHETGDIFILHGQHDQPHRYIQHITLHDNDAKTPAELVIKRAATIYKKHGLSDLDVFIVPHGGLPQKGHPSRECRFSICTDADWHRLLGDSQKPPHGKETEADRLLASLQALMPQARSNGARSVVVPRGYHHS